MIRPAPALLLPFFLACGAQRPAAVPKDAVWVGEKDRGAWVQLGEREGARWKLKVWRKDGALLVDGAFVLRGMARAAIEPHELAAWDGRQIALKDGTLLVPTP